MSDIARDRQKYELPLLGKYNVRTTPIDNGPKVWNSLLVEIFSVRDVPTSDGDATVATETKIGEYTRNYHSLYATFHPFLKGGKEYALYARDYTATRVMSLPDCVDLGGEESDGDGFCPVDYYVPTFDREDWTNAEVLDEMPPFEGGLGFVAGCYWGDDLDWKVQMLDLSRVEEGIVVREERFGYVKLPDMPLRDLINFDGCTADYPHIRIATAVEFNLTTGEVAHLAKSNWRWPTESEA